MTDFAILLICKFRQYKVVNIVNFVYYGKTRLKHSENGRNYILCYVIFHKFMRNFAVFFHVKRYSRGVSDEVTSGGSRISPRWGRPQKLHEIKRIWMPGGGGGGVRPKCYYVDPPLDLRLTVHGNKTKGNCEIKYFIEKVCSQRMR